MLTLTLAADPTMTAPPLELDKLTLAEARQLHGKHVDVTFTVAKPVVPSNGVTVFGAEDTADGVERGAVLTGECRGIGVGDRETVSGVLRVVRHPEKVVGGVTVPAWIEVVVRGAAGRRDRGEGGHPGDRGGVGLAQPGSRALVPPVQCVEHLRTSQEGRAAPP